MGTNGKVESDKKSFTSTKKIIFAIMGIIDVIVLIAFTFWMLQLHTLYPGHFGFIIDWNNLYLQAEGLVWTFILIMILFFFTIGIFFLVEARTTENEARKNFHFGMMLFLIFVGLALLTSLLYSIFAAMGITIFPDAIPGVMQGYFSWLFTLGAISMIYLLYCIEKYLKHRENKFLTKMIVILMCFGVLSIIFSYIPAITYGQWYQVGGQIFLFLPSIGSMVGGMYMLITYRRLAVRSSGELRAASLRIAIGFLIAMTGSILHMYGSYIIFPFSWIIFISITIIGVIILIQGYIRMPYDE